jgi:predicted HNH restriction endonuclease
MQPLHINILPSILKQNTYYLVVNEFNEFKYRVSMKRLDRSNLTLYNSLYDKQRGICKYCNLFMHMYDDQIELHHIYKLSNCDTKQKIKVANRKVNLLLLHQSCHKLLHRNEEDAIKKHLLK